MNYPLKDTILIGDQDTLKFRTSVNKGDRMVFDDVAESAVPGLEILGKPVTDTLSQTGNNLELESRIIVTSFDSGSYQLPSFIAYKIKEDGSVDTLSFDGGELYVKTIQIDTASYTPFDVKDQMNYPFTVKDVFPWVGVLLFLLLMLALISRIVKKLRDNKGLFAKPEVSEPPHIKALRELEELRGMKLWTSDQKEFFSVITDILREYIENRYSTAAMEKTSSEIIDELSGKSIEKELFRELSDLLNTSDLIKFAKFRTSVQECEKAVPVAVKFINSTYVTQLEEEKEDEKVSNTKGDD